ncbi:MAG: response regulator [Bdellovibrionales bacterium]|nr:response regulator [Bdellovibrionales bacterium]
MKRLQELIIRLGILSVDQINQAIFSYPEVGLIESIAREFGEEMESRLLRAIATHLGVPLLQVGELEVDDALLSEQPVELGLLVEKHKSIPVRRSGEGAEARLLVALIDPFDEEGLEGFRRLYALPVVPALARERDIQIAFAAKSAKLTLAAREVLQQKSETAFDALTKYSEDPETRKAIQQLTATAVKHSVASVAIPLDAPFTRAIFQFPDGNISSVEISVSPRAILASLLRRGQVREHNASGFDAISRIDFKASSVDCDLEVTVDASGGRLLTLTQFSIDRLDNPVFWQSLTEDNARKLKRLFKSKHGVYLVASTSEHARSVALRALKQSYSDVHSTEAAQDLRSNRSIFERGQQARVLVGVGGTTAFDVVAELEQLSVEERRLIRGLLVYYLVPSVCACCATRVPLADGDVVGLPDGLSIQLAAEQRGSGCEVCGGTGYLGTTGVSVVFDMGTGAGKRLLEGASLHRIADAFVREGGESLIENGMRQAELGRCSVREVLENVPGVHDAYLSARVAEIQRSQAVLDSDDGVVLRDPEQVELDQHVRGDDAGNGLSDFSRPVTGAAAFYRDLRSRNGKHDGERNKEPSLLPPPPAAAEKSVPTVRPRAEGPALLLVIDDDPDQRAILRRVFELEGYRVETAADGVDGIVSANRLHPTLIIVDFMMPDLDGRETIQRLKNSPATAEIPIVALTAYASPDVEYGLLKAGADDFCAKSVSKKVLLRRIERLVGAPNRSLSTHQ